VEKFSGQIVAVARRAGAQGEVGAASTAVGAGVVAAVVLPSIADSRDIHWEVGGCKGFADPLGGAPQG
jgi:hypothetical protein